MLQRSRGDVRVLTDGGIVLGIFPDAKYLDGAMHLEPGNKLLLFTDGIMEATNTRGQEYGEDRLRRELDDDPSGETATLHHKLMQDVSEFCQGNFADDATPVLISFLPSARAPVIQ